MNNRSWIPYAGVAAVAAILAGVCFSIRPLSEAFTILGGLSGASAIGIFIVGNRRNRYDLAELQRVQEKAELDEIDVPDVDEFDSVRCFCGAVYNKRLPVCPECRRSQHSSCSCG